MKYLPVYLYSFFLLNCCAVCAQHTRYLSEGRIEFEKKVHTHAFMNNDNSWSEAMRKAVPKFRITYHNLFFHNQSTLYKPGKSNPDQPGITEGGADENIVHSQLDQQQYTAQKKVYDQVYLVKDSTRVIRWKITSETRTIAGFECRRANALLFDSVYVVAFYTDAIITPGGPESLNGLPGMILGFAIPEQHVTWFATKVYAEEIKDDQLKIPVKGKQVSHKELREALELSLKRWGDYGDRLILTAML